MQHAWPATRTLHQSRCETRPDLARLTVGAPARPGPAAPAGQVRGLRLVRGTRSRPALRDQVEGALAVAAADRLGRLAREQRAYLDDFWARADVELEGDDEIQQAVRFGMFHVLQAGRAGRGPADPGQGPVRQRLRRPRVLGRRDLRAARCSPTPSRTPPRTSCAGGTARLPGALERARQLGLRGAAFPWRTISGEECSGYWPAGTAAFHVNADIAARRGPLRGRHRRRPVRPARTGHDLLVETARLWPRSATWTTPAAFRIDGVTGPDEYSAIADNNVYTNLMAQQNLRAAADVAERYPARARDLHVSADEIAAWRAAADGMLLPYDEKLGVHPQAEGFTQHQVWDFAGTRPGAVPAAEPLSPTSTCTASRWSSRPTWCWPCSCARTRSPPSRRRATSPTTRRSPSGTPRCPRAPRRSSPPRPATSTWPTTTWPNPP